MDCVHPARTCRRLFPPPHLYLPPCDEGGTETTHRRRLLVGNSPETNMLDKALFNMALRLKTVKTPIVCSFHFSG